MQEFMNQGDNSIVDADSLINVDFQFIWNNIAFGSAGPRLAFFGEKFIY